MFRFMTDCNISSPPKEDQLRLKLLEQISELEATRINMPKSMDSDYIRIQAALTNAEINMSIALGILNGDEDLDLQAEREEQDDD